MIEILVLQALVHEAHGDIPLALVPLERALDLAEPEGYIRVLVDEGEPMRSLLRHAAADGIASSYTQRLLTTFGFTEQPVSTTSGHPGAPDLAAPLTEREAELLRLISVGMTNQEIAGQLVISVATVKRHIANIYGKLGVSHRTQATARAIELNLLQGIPDRASLPLSPLVVSYACFDYHPGKWSDSPPFPQKSSGSPPFLHERQVPPFRKAMPYPHLGIPWSDSQETSFLPIARAVP